MLQSKVLNEGWMLLSKVLNGTARVLIESRSRTKMVTHCRYRMSSCWLQRDQWKRWKAAWTRGAMMLPMRTSSPQRFPCPSCSMPSLTRRHCVKGVTDSRLQQSYTGQVMQQFQTWVLLYSQSTRRWQIVQYAFDWHVLHVNRGLTLGMKVASSAHFLTGRWAAVSGAIQIG